MQQDQGLHVCAAESRDTDAALQCCACITVPAWLPVCLSDKDCLTMMMMTMMMSIVIIMMMMMMMIIFIIVVIIIVIVNMIVVDIITVIIIVISIILILIVIIMIEISSFLHGPEPCCPTCHAC